MISKQKLSVVVIILLIATIIAYFQLVMNDWFITPQKEPEQTRLKDFQSLARAKGLRLKFL